MRGCLWFLALALHLSLALRGETNAAPTTVTFNKDIAPIIYRSCAPCHHPGESTPFDLIRYTDVAKRAQQIIDVTSKAYMPPWPPITGHGYPDLIGARRLNDRDLELIRRWVSDGAREGAEEDLPPALGGRLNGSWDRLIKWWKCRRLTTYQRRARMFTGTS